ncbi:hypothetical protein BZG36_05212 [Bifiguratus adelaidae]|uniref:Peptide hydrolase n=1 Tax=Bifiguratus adelaidae TaxID=1938954 RepID=A0A261XUS3_9FUNG|nr:hypothetical protein BZG36_05212 [Bifiguratus adelaidae]
MSFLPSRPVDREKAEADLAQNIKKATSPEETAPKQKHVRSCIVYTWDYHMSASIWAGLKVQPILSDEVQIFKALITVHKIIRQGHPVVLKDAQRETSWIETCARSTVGDGMKGYGRLIRGYVDFILSKLSFHKQHQEFNGTFEYEEYITLKGIDDPNEGYETIGELMNLQDQIDQFQKLIFNNFRGSSNNECRIAALVPLVEESYGIYKFITSMLRAMHRTMDALAPLRTRYNSQHYALLKFYYECSNLRYLTSLISVPKLPQDPPDLTISDSPTPGARKVGASTPPPAQPDPSQVIDFWSEAQAQQQKEYDEEQARLARQREEELGKQRRLQEQQQREFEEQQRLQYERQRQQQEELMRQQMQRQAAGRLAELEREVLGLRGQFERDQMLLDQYDKRVKALENELAQMNLNAQQRDASKDELIKSLQDQITVWKNKYDALAKLYSQLRQEHLDLLNKYKQLQLKANNAQEAVDKYQKMQQDMRAKNMELADMIRERDRAKNDLARLQGSHNDEIARLRKDLADSNYRVEELGKNKGAEVASLLGRFNREKAELERAAKDRQRQLDELMAELDLARGEADRMAMEKDEELAIMQAGMDECLQQLADLQDSLGDSESKLQEKLDTLTADHVDKLNEILDTIFANCIQKLNDGIYELENPGTQGNTNATPEYALSMIERASTASSEFMSAFGHFLDGSNSGDHASAITTALGLAQTLDDVMINAKGITRYAAEDSTVDALIASTREVGDSCITFLSNVMSSHLNSLPRPQRPEVVLLGDMEVQEALQRVSKQVEELTSQDAANVAKMAEGEVGDLVEQEMMNAARAIEDAAARIQELMNKPRDPQVSATDMQVHSSILEAVMAITNAIANLIKRAAESQQEIVAQGRGTSSKAAFYKKNNRWTEGLISAAKAVAVATNLLVEAADGVIHGTHSLEQLIVASNEVAAATAQLVAASRVKATFMSKTQERLELAAKAVTDASQALVRAVRGIAAKRMENKANNIDFNKLSPHEFKVREMEQQVKILELEQALVLARQIVSVGSFIIDDIRYEDGTEQLGVVGGGGTHMIYGKVMSQHHSLPHLLIGARLWKRGPSHSKTIGYQLQMGFDFPADVEQQLDRLHLSLEKRRHPHLFTPRAWNIFGPSEQRGFEYQHKNIQTFPSSLPKTWILFAKLLHFICTPERAEKISDEWRALQAQYAHDFAVPQDQLAQTLFLWEPLPTAAIPEQWEATKAVMAKVHMVTPNHDEAAGFLGKTFDHIVQDHEGDHIKALVYLAQTFLASGIGPNGEDLDGSGQVNLDTLDLTIVVQGIFTVFTAKTGLLVSTKRCIGIKLVVAVDPDCTGVKGIGDLDSLGHVLGEHGGTETVDRCVGLLNHFFHCLEFAQDNNRSENFLLYNLHILLDIGEHGKSRTNLPCKHEQGEVPGDNAPDDTNGLVASVGEDAGGINDLAMDLVGPSCVVSDATDQAGNISRTRKSDGLAIVLSLDLSQFLGIAFHEIGELVHQTSTLGGRSVCVHRFLVFSGQAPSKGAFEHGECLEFRGDYNGAYSIYAIKAACDHIGESSWVQQASTPEFGDQGGRLVAIPDDYELYTILKQVDLSTEQQRGNFEWEEFSFETYKALVAANAASTVFIDSEQGSRSPYDSKVPVSVRVWGKAISEQVEPFANRYSYLGLLNRMRVKLFRLWQQEFFQTEQQVVDSQAAFMARKRKRIGSRVLIAHNDQTMLLAQPKGMASYKSLRLPLDSVILPVADMETEPAVTLPENHPIQSVLKNLHYNEDIASIVKSVNISKMEQDVTYLSGERDDSPIKERTAYTKGAQMAAEWVKEQFEAARCHNVTFMKFMDNFSPNVICEFTGTESPDELVILGAHYDSRGSWWGPRAPGANDDGSGTSMLLQSVDLIRQHNISFAKTVQVVAFSGEEEGLLGSKAYAQQLKAENANITLMIQGDMLAYHKPGEPMQCGFPGRYSTKEVIALAANITNLYAPELVTGETMACCSDHQSFWELGYASTQFFERNGPIADPMYHNSNDLAYREGYDFKQLGEITKAMFATVLAVLLSLYEVYRLFEVSASVWKSCASLDRSETELPESVESSVGEAQSLLKTLCVACDWSFDSLRQVTKRVNSIEAYNKRCEQGITPILLDWLECEFFIPTYPSKLDHDIVSPQSQRFSLNVGKRPTLREDTAFYDVLGKRCSDDIVFQVEHTAEYGNRLLAARPILAQTPVLSAIEDLVATTQASQHTEPLLNGMDASYRTNFMFRLGLDFITRVLAEPLPSYGSEHPFLQHMYALTDSSTSSNAYIHKIHTQLCQQKIFQYLELYIYTRNAILDANYPHIQSVEAFEEYFSFGFYLHFQMIVAANAFCDADTGIVSLHCMAAMANHTCEPNLKADIQGSMVTYTAKRDIKAGEELTIAYHPFIEDRQERLDQLGLQYGFHCQSLVVVLALVIFSSNSNTSNPSIDLTHSNAIPKAPHHHLLKPANAAKDTPAQERKGWHTPKQISQTSNRAYEADDYLSTGPNESNHYQLLVLIASPASDLSRRRLLRKHYFGITDNLLPCMEANAQIYYKFWIYGDSEEEIDSEILRKLEAEKMEYDDVVQVAGPLAADGITFDYFVFQDINTFLHLPQIRYELLDGIIGEDTESPYILDPEAPTNLVWGVFGSTSIGTKAIIMGQAAVRFALDNEQKIRNSQNNKDPFLTQYYNYVRGRQGEDGFPVFIHEDPDPYDNLEEPTEYTPRFISWENNVESVHYEDIAVTDVIQDDDLEAIAAWTQLSPIRPCYPAISVFSSQNQAEPLDDDQVDDNLLGFDLFGLRPSPSSSHKPQNTPSPVAPKTYSIAVMTSSFIYPENCMLKAAYPSAQNKRQYALQHGYSFIARSQEFAQQSSSAVTRKTVWGKINALEKALPKYDWLFWLDMDAVIMNPNIAIEDLLAKFQKMVDNFSDIHLIVAQPTGDKMINAGVLLIRNSAVSAAFLRTVNTAEAYFMDSPAYEQKAMWEILQQPKWRKHVLVLDGDNHTFNTFPKRYNWGDFVVHYAPDKCPADAVMKGLATARRTWLGQKVENLEE